MKKVLLVLLALLLATSITVPGVALAGKPAPGASWAMYSEYTVGEPASYQLIADQTIVVGNITVWNDATEVHVQYNTSDPWYLTETHLAVATDYSGIPQNKKGSPKPGHFDYGDDSLSPPASSVTYDISLPGGVSDGDTLVIMAHCVVVKIVDDEVVQEETAWSDGPGDEPEWPEVSYVAFEDLEEDDPTMDYDYNDWVANINITLSFDGTDLEQVDFGVVEPQSRGAGYNHVFHIRIPANTFASDGTYTYTLYDEDGVTVVTSDSGSFVANVDFDQIVIPNTTEALPGFLTNTIEPEGVVSHYPDEYDPMHEPYVPAQRTAELTIVFTNPAPFSTSGYDPTDFHGDGLFYDPYLHVIDTGEDIHQGDIRMITIPDNWLWPEAGIAIWDAYPLVTESLSGTPTFVDDWWTVWTGQGTPTTDDDLIYNGPASP